MNDCIAFTHITSKLARYQYSATCFTWMETTRAPCFPGVFFTNSKEINQYLPPCLGFLDDIQLWEWWMVKPEASSPFKGAFKIWLLQQKLFKTLCPPFYLVKNSEINQTPFDTSSIKTKRLRHGPVAFFFVELLQGRPQTEGKKETLYDSSFPVTRCPGPM